MSVSVVNQCSVFLVMIAGGLGIGVLYDLFFISGSAAAEDKLTLGILDFLFWVSVLLMVFGLLYYASGGEVRAYEIAGLILGFGVYKIFLSACMRKIILRVIVIFLKFFIVFFKIVLTPLVFLYRMLKEIMQLLCKLLGLVFNPVVRFIKYICAGYKIKIKQMKYRMRKI